MALWGWALMRALIGAGRERWRRTRAILLAGLATALLCLPGLPVALRQLATYRNPNLVVPRFGAYLAELARVYSLGEHLDPSAAQPWALLLAGWLVIGWLLLLIRRRASEAAEQRSSESTNQRISESANQRTKLGAFAIRPFAHSPIRPFALWLFAFAWATVPVFVYYLVIRDRSTFASRYIAVALPGWLLLGGLALRGWASLGRWPAALAAGSLVVILAPGLRGDLLDSRFFREDTRGLVAWLKAQTEADDLILVDQRYPFGFYYPRWNDDAAGFPPPEPAELAPAQYLFVDINAVDDRLTALVQGHTRVFWVRWFESDTDPRGAVPFLLEKFGSPQGEQAFRGYAVSWYAVAPDTRFELAPALSAMGADFGDQVRLVGAAFGGSNGSTATALADTRAPRAPADGAIWATLRWQQLPGAERPLKAKLTLEDADGVVVGQDERPLLNDRHLALPYWGAEDRPLGVYLVHPRPATPPGAYTLKLAVYDPVTLAPLPMAGGVLGQVTLTRASRPADIEQLPIETPVALAWRGLRLLGRGPLPVQLAPGDRLAFDLFWEAEQDALPDLRAQFALTPVDPGGAGGAQWEPLPEQRSLPVQGYATDAWAAGEVLVGRQQWRLDPGMAAGVYQLTLRLADAAGPAASDAGSAASAPVVLGQVIIAGRPHVYEPPVHMDERSGAQLGGFARLLGFDLGSRALTAGDELALTLYWQAAGASETSFKVFAQLLDGSGVLRAQADQEPGAGAFPTTGWVAGEILTDPYRITLPAGMPTGRYTLIIGMYNPVSSARLPVTAAATAAGAAGAAPGDALALGSIEVH